jgi:hypothetical protein
MYAACKTVRDLDQLYSDLGMDNVTRSACDPELPDVGEVWAGATCYAPVALADQELSRAYDNRRRGPFCAGMGRTDRAGGAGEIRRCLNAVGDRKAAKFHPGRLERHNGGTDLSFKWRV